MSIRLWQSKQAGDEAAGHGHSGGPRWELAEALGRLFEGPLLGARGAMGGALDPGGGFWPALDVTEDDKHVVVRAEVPGVDPGNIEVTVVGNTLSLSGHKEESHEDKGKDYYRSERMFGSFRRRVELPEGIDPDNVTAECEGGVLTVRLDKKQGGGARKIPISSQAAGSGGARRPGES